MPSLKDRIDRLELLSAGLTKKETYRSFLDPLFAFLDHLESYAAITDTNDRLIYLNPSFKTYLYNIDINYNLDDPLPWWEEFGWSDNPSDKDLITKECINKRKVVNHSIKSRVIKDVVYDIVCIPLKYNGVAAVLSIVRIKE